MLFALIDRHSTLKEAVLVALPARSSSRRALGHTDGGRLVMTLYGHPDERRARDRLRMAFAYDGHKSAENFPARGHISDASA